MGKRFKKAIGLIACTLLLFAVLMVLAIYVNRMMEKRAYSLDNMAQIKAFAQEYGLDAFLVAALIHAESAGNADAVSPKGAVGLMQIMPKTGEWVAQKINMTDYDESRLAKPEVNLRLGCWYLSYLLDKYDANVTNALAAYNAGPGNVDKWLKDETLSRGGELVEIPFGETARYVEKVHRARQKYMEYYEDELS